MATSSSGSLTRFFGGSPVAVILKLILLSVVIGVLLSVLGLDAFDLVRSAQRLFRSLFANAAEAFETVLSWFLLGAVIVFPIWLLLRLFQASKG